MARDFPGTDNNYIQTGATPVTAVPVTIACRFLPDDNTPAAFQVLGGVFPSAGTANGWYLALETNGRGIAGTAQNGSFSEASTTAAAVAVAGWNHIVGVSQANNNRIVYLN